MTSHHAFIGHDYGICGKLSRLRRATFQQTPQPRQRRLNEINNSVIQGSGARSTRLGKLYLLDTGLLMGGILSRQRLPGTQARTQAPKRAQTADGGRAIGHGYGYGYGRARRRRRARVGRGRGRGLGRGYDELPSM
ncbi:hypothetical protein LCGC14_2122750, partial [marine sediment metagenome]